MPLTTPFLMQFSVRLVQVLLEREHIEVSPGAQMRVAQHIAATLHGSSMQSLVSLVIQSLERCDEVEEFYIGNDELKDLVTDLGVMG